MTSQHVPVYGNYHGYYSKRPFVNDPRLALLPENIFTGKTVLDVGCNEGWVTVEIAQKWGADKVVGVDIDETLIRAAWKRRLAAWSQQAPLTTRDEHEDVVKKKKRRRTEPETEMTETEQTPPADYFPASFEHMFGPLPIPPFQNRGRNAFPHNISFRAGDWVKDLEAVPEDKQGYDVIVAFSISKWIHLNQGDEGLKVFFRRVREMLLPGGKFVLEPQSWDKYKKARRIVHSSHELHLRPEDFPSVLAELGFSPPQHVGMTGEDGFRRPVDIYTRL